MPGSTAGWDAIRARVATIGRAHVRAGVVGHAAERAHGDSGLTIGELATLHELGNPSTGLPPRSFVSATMRDPAVRSQFAALEARLLAAVLAGKMSRDQALGLLGEWAAAQIRDTITSGDVAPPLAASTIAAKGDARPLIETGALAAAVGYEVIR